MNKHEAALFRSGTRAGAVQDAFQFASDCVGDLGKIRAEIKDRRERLRQSSRPEHQPGASPRIYLDTYIDELEHIVAELEAEVALAV